MAAKFCDVGHRVEWAANSGTTDQQNAMPACGVHDRWKHANKIRSRRATNGRIYLIRPDGSVIKPIGESEPDWAEPDPNAPDPFACFGRPMTADELTGRPIDPALGWTLYTIHIDTVIERNR